MASLYCCAQRNFGPQARFRLASISDGWCRMDGGWVRTWLISIEFSQWEFIDGHYWIIPPLSRTPAVEGTFITRSSSLRNLPARGCIYEGWVRERRIVLTCVSDLMLLIFHYQWLSLLLWARSSLKSNKSFLTGEEWSTRWTYLITVVELEIRRVGARPAKSVIC